MNTAISISWAEFLKVCDFLHQQSIQVLVSGSLSLVKGPWTFVPSWPEGLLEQCEELLFPVNLSA